MDARDHRQNHDGAHHVHTADLHVYALDCFGFIGIVRDWCDGVDRDGLLCDPLEPFFESKIQGKIRMKKTLNLLYVHVEIKLPFYNKKIVFKPPVNQRRVCSLKKNFSFFPLLFSFVYNVRHTQRSPPRSQH